MRFMQPDSQDQNFLKKGRKTHFLSQPSELGGTKRSPPVFIHTCAPRSPATASIRPPTGIRSQLRSFIRSPDSRQDPSSTRSSAPPGASTDISAPGDQVSSCTVSRKLLKRGTTATPGRSGAATAACSFMFMVTAVRSVRSNCHSLTKMVQPIFEAG